MIKRNNIVRDIIISETARNFFGFELGITPNDHDGRIRIGSFGTSDDVAALCIGMVRDTAGVDHHHIGLIFHAHPGITRF